MYSYKNFPRTLLNTPAVNLQVFLCGLLHVYDDLRWLPGLQGHHWALSFLCLFSPKCWHSASQTYSLCPGSGITPHLPLLAQETHRSPIHLGQVALRLLAWPETGLCVCLWVCGTEESGKGCEIPRSGVTGGWELDVGARISILVLVMEQQAFLTPKPSLLSMRIEFLKSTFVSTQNRFFKGDLVSYKK